MSAEPDWQQTMQIRWRKVPDLDMGAYSIKQPPVLEQLWTALIGEEMAGYCDGHFTPYKPAARLEEWRAVPVRSDFMSSFLHPTYCGCHECRNSPLKQQQFDTHTFQLKEVAMQIQIHREEFRITEEREIRELLRAELRAYVVSEDATPLIIGYPLNWWEHFKQRWFPKWALKRWPVRQVTHTITASALFPYFKPKIPEQGPPVFKLAHYKTP